MTGGAGEGALRVLAVLDDVQVARTIQRVVTEEGDAYTRVASVEEAVTFVAKEPVDVAFIELRAESGAALALCHHLPSVRPELIVQAIVHPSDLARGPEALSLGATAILLSPLTGDGVSRVLSDAKAERARRRKIEAVDALERQLSHEKQRVALYDRLVRYARTGAPSEAVRAIVEGLTELGDAKGVALYASFDADDRELVRLAAVGSAIDLPQSPGRAELAQIAGDRRGRVVPLSAVSGELGLLVVEPVEPNREAELLALADLAAAMLSLLDRHDRVDARDRIFPERDFQTVSERMLALAARHDRRASLLVISVGDRSTRREEIVTEIADIVRHTDALCGTEEGDLLLFLPETTSTGAHVCRRRVVARLAGDRRARPKSGPTRATEASATRPPVAVGVASFPHDGTSLRRLIRTARGRAREDALSSVHALALDAMSLAEIVDALLERPVIDAGPRSPYPLDVAHAGLSSVVQRACRDALRGGEAHVLATFQPGLGVATAAGQVTKPRVLDVRKHPRCADLEAIVVEAEHGVWICCGRVVGNRFRGVHAADPLLADVIGRRLVELGGLRAS